MTSKVKQSRSPRLRKPWPAALCSVLLLWCALALPAAAQPASTQPASTQPVSAQPAGQAPQGDARSQEFLTRVRQDTEWLSGHASRQIGTESHEVVQKQLLEKLHAIPGAKVWTEEFDVLVPVNEKTTLKVTEGDPVGTQDIYPIWPDGVRLNTTPEDGISGRFVYIGDAGFDQLPARGLHGQIAVMEMSAYAEYRRAFDFGAAAVIFIESKVPGESLASQQSLNKPRYYVSDPGLADALRSGRAKAGRIDSQQSWKTVKARNIYVAIKPDGSAGVKPYAVVAPYDSMSRVMGVAPGADAALDCAIALNVLRDEAVKPSRPLLFGFLDAYHINQLGMRRMAAMLTVTPEGRTRQQYEQIESDHLEEYEAADAELSNLGTMEQGIDRLHERSTAFHLKRLFKDTLGRDLLRLRELQGELRLASMRTDKETSPAVRQHSLSTLDRTGAWLLRNHREELTPEQVAGLESAREFALAEMRSSAGRPVDAEWLGLAKAREHAKTMLAICSEPLTRRNRILDAAFASDRTVEPGDMSVARMAWDQMADRVRGQVREQRERLEFFKPLDRQRAEIADFFGSHDDRRPEVAQVFGPLYEQCVRFVESFGIAPFDLGGDRICPFVIGIDISDCGVLVGPGVSCGFNRIETLDKDFAKVLKRAVKRDDIWPLKSPARQFVNVGAIEGRVGGSDLGERALITSAASSFLLPGVTWVTDDAPRPLVDSPLDRADRLDWDRIASQLPPTRMFLSWAFTNNQYQPDVKSVDQTSAKWRNGMGRIVDVSAGETVPRVPRRGFLASLTGSAVDADGIRRVEFARTGHDGSFRIPLMCADVTNGHKALELNAFNLNAQGAIIEALTTATQSMVSARLTTGFSLGTDPGEQLPRAVTFECTELNGPSFYDARFLQPLTQGKLIDAVRGGAPKQAHFSIDATGQMWGLVEPGTRWQLTVGAGASGVRMALLNAAPGARDRGLSLSEAFQRGYSVEQELPSIPSQLSAQDIFELNGWRLTDFRKAGISSEKINEIRGETEQALGDATAAVEADDGAKLHRASVQALASEIRAYRAVSETGQDVVRGAIFLMLILVPFSVAMERLLFAFARIGSQIVGAVAIFAAMTLLLWSFHPAFRISAQPLVIVMAFTILAMSVAVISIVLSRFRGSMREIQSSLAEGSGARMGRGGLLGSAVFLGIANMRKRKVRTALTGSTLVLVTFALLCFSSASSYVDKKDFRLEDVKAVSPSVMVRRPSLNPIPYRAVEDINNVLGDMGVKAQARVWMVAKLNDIKYQTWRVWSLNPATGQQAPLMGVLGLPPGEDKLSGVDAVLPNWQQFASEGGCYLSHAMAQQLGVKPGQNVVIRGHDLVLRGTYDAIQLEDQIKLLDGQRILPYDYTKQEQDWANRNAQDVIEKENESASAMQPSSNDADMYLSADDVIIVPTTLAYELGGDLRSVGIVCDSAQQAADVASRLTQTIVYPAYYSNAKGGVNVVVATPLIPVPPRSIAVPLVIAALIIFTTMLNSVSERKKEIYVYASLGLAPIHIGALFVAEALTYGLMGAVFGYIAGQGTATLLTSLGLMQGVTLNYSGTAVINTMLLVQLVVVLAALVPAIIAGRVASPSSETDWRVPEPVDGVITSTLPFTVSAEAAPGLIAFIHEYLEAHRDGVLGRFDVDEVRLLPASPGNYVVGLEARIWLAPFDVGVRQVMTLTIQEPVDEVCDIGVRVAHETGSPKLWWRLNKPFFFEIRRQLLGWRKVTPERVEEYVVQLQAVTGVAAEAGR